MKVGDRVKVAEQRNEYFGMTGEIVGIDPKGGLAIVQLEVKLPNWRVLFAPEDMELEIRTSDR